MSFVTSHLFCQYSGRENDRTDMSMIGRKKGVCVCGLGGEGLREELKIKVINTCKRSKLELRALKTVK